MSIPYPRIGTRPMGAQALAMIYHSIKRNSDYKQMDIYWC